MTLTIHAVRGDRIWFRTDGPYVSATRREIVLWQGEFAGERAPETIHRWGNTLDESDVIELRVNVETSIRETARATGGAA